MSLAAAERYLASGLCVLPAVRRGDTKRVALRTWKPYQSRPPTREELAAWFGGRPRDMCVVCGAVSGNLEVIDFDLGGEAFEPWRNTVEAAAPGLVGRLVIESTPSGGRHVAYRCGAPVGGSAKLAGKRIEAEGPEELVVGARSFRPRQDAEGRWHVMVTTIETRGEGGVFLCAPSEGYELVQGDPCAPPVLTADERDVLLGCARALDEAPAEVVGGAAAPASAASDALRPGDDFNTRGDVREVLRAHGWRLVHPGDNEHWCRPGKEHGTSATLKGGVFYVFSTSAPPFEAQKGYAPFAVYALLEQGGDFAAAAAALRARGYGANEPAGDVDLSAFAVASGGGAPTPGPPDPGPVPASLLRVPGFVGEVMDHCLATAPYPNPTLAFCGALALQAFLAGRKVRDPGDNRTNLYLLGLAHSAAGKDWPRRLNTRILHEAGLADCLGERFASGEGIQDALFQTPAMLFQTDEIDGLLQSINRAKDARHEAIMSTLLTMYSSASGVFPMRRKAGMESPGVIDQPCLVVFGTAIPNHYYEALSERMLTNGFFARMIILEAGPRGAGQEPSIRALPQRVLETARWWAALPPGAGNLGAEHPRPRVVGHTKAAKRLLVGVRCEAEAEYTRAEAAQDAVGTTVWGRVSEQVRKLALLHAVSARPTEPEIGAEAVRWASALVTHQTRRMLFMAAGHVAESPFHADCLRLIKKLREAPGHRLAHSVLLKRMKLRAKDFHDLVETLAQRGDIEVRTTPRAGSPVVEYELIGGDE